MAGSTFLAFISGLICGGSLMSLFPDLLHELLYERRNMPVDRDIDFFNIKRLRAEEGWRLVRDDRESWGIVELERPRFRFLTVGESVETR